MTRDKKRREALLRMGALGGLAWWGSAPAWGTLAVSCPAVPQETEGHSPLTAPPGARRPPVVWRAARPALPLNSRRPASPWWLTPMRPHSTC
jgi:hypothetical protein